MSPCATINIMCLPQAMCEVCKLLHFLTITALAGWGYLGLENYFFYKVAFLKKKIIIPFKNLCFQSNIDTYIRAVSVGMKYLKDLLL